jgi:hypothetical protein
VTRTTASAYNVRILTSLRRLAAAAERWSKLTNASQPAARARRSALANSFTADAIKDIAILGHGLYFDIHASAE